MAYILNVQDLESRANKVQTINTNSTADQYPSAKAVYDAIGSGIDNNVSTERIENLENNKVDKVAGNKSSSQLYAVDPQGNPKTFTVSVGAIGNAVPIYNPSDASLHVQSTPTSATAATSKKYVDDSIKNRVSELTTSIDGKVNTINNKGGALGDGHSVVYAARVDGTDSYFPLTFAKFRPNSIVAYDTTGHIEVNVPDPAVSGYGTYAVNKNWVYKFNRDIIKSPNFIKNASYATSPETNYSIMTAYGNNQAQGFASAAFGELNFIEGDKIDGVFKGSQDSLAAGARNRITGNGGKSALLGLGNISTASCSFAANRYNTVKAVSAFALGERNQVSANAAGALGKGLIAKEKNQVVVGKFNADNSNALFVVGNGTNTRSNVMTVQKDGTLTLGGHLETIELSTIDKNNVYNFESVDGTKTATLYRITDTPCEYGKTREWLTGRTITIDGVANPVKITNDMIVDETNTETDYEEWCDVRQNHVVIYNNQVILCVVDSIFHDSMDAPELGIYVSNIVKSLSCDKWIDHPLISYGTENDMNAIVEPTEGQLFIVID